MTSGDLEEALRRIASRRSQNGIEAAPAEAPAPPRARVHESTMRAGISALLRGETPALAPDLGRVPADALFEIRGAGSFEVDGERTFWVRRRVNDIVPQLDVSGEIGEALGRLDERDPGDIYHGLLPARGHGRDDVAVIDLETTGFWGCPIFLVGLLVWEEGDPVTMQFVARDYPEESRILRAAAAVLGKRRLLVSFNGKSYDVPCFRERAVLHGVANRVDSMSHVDVLHAARRRFREELPDCRLQTLEKSVVGIDRRGDVPSAEIPALYHGFAATGEIHLLLPVLHHSRVDLVTTALILGRVID